MGVDFVVGFGDCFVVGGGVDDFVVFDDVEGNVGEVVVGDDVVEDVVVGFLVR